MPPSIVDSGAHSTGRWDALAIKQQLADALGENGPLYWRALTDFITGKLNRQEFDFYANLYIPADQVHLHNSFILATIHNAHHNDQPPDVECTVEWSRKRKYGDGCTLNGTAEEGNEEDAVLDIAKQQKIRRKKLKQLIQSMSKADRRMIRQLLKKQEPKASVSAVTALVTQANHRPVIPVSIQQITSSAVTDYARGVQAPLCFDEKGIPDVESIRDRLVAIALEHGLLDGVASDAVEVLLYGLDAYLRNILSNCFTKVRVNRSTGIRYQHHSTDTIPSQTTLRLNDLLFALEISPHVLTETPLSVERLGSFTLYESDSEDEEYSSTPTRRIPPLGSPYPSVASKPLTNGNTVVPFAYKSPQLTVKPSSGLAHHVTVVGSTPPSGTS